MLPGGGVGRRVRRARPCPPSSVGVSPGTEVRETQRGGGWEPLTPCQAPRGQEPWVRRGAGWAWGRSRGTARRPRSGKDTLGVPGGCVWLWGRVRPSGAVTHSGGKPPPRLRSQGDGSLPDLCLPGPRPPDSCGTQAPAGAQIMRHTAPVCQAACCPRLCLIRVPVAPSLSAPRSLRLWE